MNLYPTTLQRDIIKKHAGPFIFCFLTLMFLLIMQFLMLFADRIIGKDLPLSIIIELILNNVAYMVTLALPLAVLVSTLMAYGHFSELNELTAVKAAGIHPLRIVTPTLAAASIVAVFMAWFGNYVLPEANFKSRALFTDIRLKKPGFDLKPNTFYDGIEGYTFLVRSMAADSDTLYDITLFQKASTTKEEAVIKASKGILESVPNAELLTLKLYRGQIQRYITGRQDYNPLMDITDFEQYRITFDLGDLSFSRSNPNQRTRDDRTMTAQAMLAVIDSVQREIDKNITTFIDKNQRDATSGIIRLDTIQNTVSGIQKHAPVRLAAIADSLVNVSTNFIMINSTEEPSFRKYLVDQGLRGAKASVIDYDNMQMNLRWRNEINAQYWVEIHKKIAMPVGCIIFVLIGAPLGMFTRKGNLGVSAVIAAIVFTFYYISLIQGEKLADRLIISPVTGMWTGNLILGGIGVVLLIKLVKERVFRRSSHA